MSDSKAHFPLWNKATVSELRPSKSFSYLSMRLTLYIIKPDISAYNSPRTVLDTVNGNKICNTAPTFREIKVI